ncbi:MAG: hypothetical protein JST26_10650 [Bacteroidetes bacterium]|nr:hypothetical protein [Bacteroidota bacterium]
MKHVLFCLLLLSLATGCYAQQKDTIILMNGQMVVERVIDTLLGAVSVMDPEKPGEKLHYEYEELYCVKYASGLNDYYYSQDTANGNWFTRDEMLYYIKGERDARKGFKAPGALWGSFTVGLVGGASGTFFGPLLPYGYLACVGIPKVRIRHSTISNPAYIDHDPYILGYERVARGRRRIRSLIGGTAGLAVGYGIYFAALKKYFDSANSSIQFK